MGKEQILTALTCEMPLSVCKTKQKQPRSSSFFFSLIFSYIFISETFSRFYSTEHDTQKQKDVVPFHSCPPKEVGPTQYVAIF